MLEDGDGRKPSTNGTWVYTEDYLSVSNPMVFKVGSSLFEVTY